jgi:heptosyltransferase-2
MTRPLPGPVDLPEDCRLLVRATNWLGDAVMSMPAVEALRDAFPRAHLAVLVRPELAGVYRSPLVTEVIPWTVGPTRRDLRSRWRLARRLQRDRFDAAILLSHAFDAALVAWLARIPIRVGYAVKQRGALLTHAVALGSAPPGTRHQTREYLTLLHAVGFIDAVPAPVHPRLSLPTGDRDRTGGLGPGPWLGVAPGSSNGTAKRWPPDRFAEAAALAAAQLGTRVVLVGSPQDRAVCAAVSAALAARGVDAVDGSGTTDVQALMRRLSGCDVLLANDSGAMHVADALGVPTVTVFGPTCEQTTGPTGPLAAVVREPVTCSPCHLHDCPIDHRCMQRVSVAKVAAALVRVAQAGRARRRAGEVVA